MQTVQAYLEATLIPCFFTTLFWKFFEECMHSKKVFLSICSFSYMGLTCNKFYTSIKVIIMFKFIRKLPPGIRFPAHFMSLNV